MDLGQATVFTVGVRDMVALRVDAINNPLLPVRLEFNALFVLGVESFQFQVQSAAEMQWIALRVLITGPIAAPVVTREKCRPGAIAKLKFEVALFPRHTCTVDLFRILMTFKSHTARKPSSRRNPIQMVPVAVLANDVHKSKICGSVRVQRAVVTMVGPKSQRHGVNISGQVRAAKFNGRNRVKLEIHAALDKLPNTELGLKNCFVG